MKGSFMAAGMVYAALCGAAIAEEFVPPKPYASSRYETGWQKNPFTLKTTPVAIQKTSFASDLTLAGVRQSEDDTTVILANTKTREYTRLKNAEPASNGMKVKSVHLQGKRSDTYVELENGGEIAVVHYDEHFLSIMAGQTSSPQPVAQTNLQNPNPARTTTAAPAIASNSMPPQTGNVQAAQTSSPP
ncbi:MAG: hypothetical protein WCN98_13630, partial [Verrucomicrobiaceae bacterium]